MATQIPMPTGLRPPRRLAQLGELSLPLDLLRFGLQWPRLVTAPRGDGRPVYLIPGYGGSELSMRPLEAFLARINYDVADWSLGRNKGSVDRDIARFTAVAEQRFAENGGQAFTLIGWSLGGIIARETARLSPHLVREVITMGTPISPGTSTIRRPATSASMAGIWASASTPGSGGSSPTRWPATADPGGFPAQPSQACTTPIAM